MRLGLHIVLLLSLIAPDSLFAEEKDPAEASAAAATVLRHAVVDLMREYTRATNRKERISIEERLMELAKSDGLTPEVLFDVIESGEASTPDRAPFIDRGKQGTPTIEWPGQRVTLKELGWDAPDFYTLTLPPDYVETGAKTYPFVLDVGEGIGTGLVAGTDANGVVIGFVHPDAIPPEGLIGSRQGQSLLLSILADAPRRAWIDPDRIFLTGGGRQASAVFYMAAHHPHLFAGVLPYAGNFPDFRVFERNATKLGWFVVSRSPGPATMPSYEFSFDVFERMKRYGIEPSFRLLDADTNQTAFIRDAHTFVRNTNRSPWPTEFTFRIDDPDHADCYWLRVDKIKDPGKPKVIKIMDAFGQVTDTRTVNSRLCEVTAKVSESRDRIEITTDNVEHLTVMLSPELVDWSAEVEIVIDGKSRYLQKPEASLRVMMLTYRSNLDASNLPWCRVQILDL